MDYVIGGQILESLTTGMYKDSRMIFREYIQNACDAIDAAVKAGILAEGEGEIRIEIDPESRRIVIEDNGTGIRAKDFARVLGNIADSDKRIGEERGFRGIGRLCGMAYCGTVVFRSKFKGECVVSEMRCNAKILRRLLDGIAHGEKHTVSYALGQINDFTTEQTEDIDAHFFRVELEGINEEKSDLLDVGKVKEYLSLAAPVPCRKSFRSLYSRVHEHAGNLGQRIGEYNIFLNGKQLFKAYTPVFKTSLGDDEIFDVEFRDFMDAESNLIAWMWVGLSRFLGVIDKGCTMRGIRLRKGNIQIGDAFTLQRFFQEDRGIHYFVGELFCVSEDLLLNSQRDYFNETPERAYLEEQLRGFCAELKVIYTAGSALNSSFKKLKQVELRERELELRVGKDNFSDDSVNTDEELRACLYEAESYKKEFDRAAAKNEITLKIAEQIKHKPINPQQLENRAKSYSKREKQLLNRVFGILKDELGNKADLLIRKIEARLGLR